MSLNAIHFPDSRQWIAPKAIHLRTHFDKLAEAVRKAQGRGRPNVPLRVTVTTVVPLLV